MIALIFPVIMLLQCHHMLPSGNYYSHCEEGDEVSRDQVTHFGSQDCLTSGGTVPCSQPIHKPTLCKVWSKTQP